MMNGETTHPDPARHRHEPRPRGRLGLRAGRRRAGDRARQPADRRRADACSDYRMLVLPGGFSYGDDLGAGKLWAVALRYRLAERPGSLRRRRPARAGHLQRLPGAGQGRPAARPDRRRACRGASSVTLTRNDSAHFECRWVYLRPEPRSPCVFHARASRKPSTARWLTARASSCRRRTTMHELEAAGWWRCATYARPATRASGEPARYPWNPNGSRRRHRRHLQPRGHGVGADAPSRGSHRRGAGSALTTAAGAEDWA